MFKKNASVLFLLLFSFLFICSCSPIGKANDQSLATVSIDIGKFNDSRSDFKTNLISEKPAPQEYSDNTPPSGVSEIVYQSGDLELKAWLSTLPADGKTHPAIVYVHGGFSFGESDWEDIQPYLDAGYVVMAPTLRGENGNPGYFEFFYGEVDDVIAAGNYLKSQPGIDSNNVFLSGHSTGGTIALLTSMLPSPYKAIATFGASPDSRSFFKDWASIVPFDVNNSNETNIRDPQSYIQCIQKPLFVYVGKQDSAYFSKSKKLVETANKLGKLCEFIPITGDHFASLPGSIENSIEKFSQVN